MQWQDTGIVTNVKKHGESDVVLTVFTPEHGLHKGYVKGGAGRRKRGSLQPGNTLKLTWRSRLEENLGAFTFELLHSPLGIIIDDPRRLAALSATCSTLSLALAERETHKKLYDGFEAFLDILEHEEATQTDIASAMVKIELGLLKEIGFSLDFSACAATGDTSDLIYVSPKSAKAVSKAAGAAYKDRLLPLPTFLTEGGNASEQQCLDGLRLSGYFLNQHIWRVANKDAPQARTRFMKSLEKSL